jgi:glutathione synthase
MADVKKPDVEQLIGMDEFDVVMLRNDPADDAETDPWRNNAGVAFGQLIASSGVLVVNDPTSLANALSKAYFQHFPEIVRPRTLISRDEDMIEEFITDLGGKAVLKPLQGSGGAGVFLVDRKEAPNLKQIIEAISRDGYVVAQEYLPEAAKGDVRMFVMNGQPLMVDGEYAAFRRTPSTKDIRSNMSAGGKAEKVKVTDDMLQMVEVVRPKLVADGMFLVGLDIVGDKLMEINVFSPGGLGSAHGLYEVNFAPAIIAELERKVNIRKHYPEIDNTSLATS